MKNVKNKFFTFEFVSDAPNSKVEEEDVQTAGAEETDRMPPEEELMPSGITIDFPFSTTRDDDYKDAVLILACVDESVGTYKLRLYDKDKNVVQQIPCGELTENVSFFYNDLTTDGI